MHVEGKRLVFVLILAGIAGISSARSVNTASCKLMEIPRHKNFNLKKFEGNSDFNQWSICLTSNQLLSILDLYLYISLYFRSRFDDAKSTMLFKRTCES